MRVAMRLRGTACTTVVVDGLRVACRARESSRASLRSSLDEALERLRREFGPAGISDITVDVGQELAGAKRSSVLVVRISPRAPVDDSHVLRLPPAAAPSVTRIMYVAGGHDMRGRSLTSLALESFREQLSTLPSEDVAGVAITSVGSLVSPEHEMRAADAVLSLHGDARVCVSSDFPSRAFRDRESNAIVNSSLMRHGETVAALLREVGARHFPGIPLFFAKGDGGRESMARLPMLPISGLAPEPAMHVVGGAALAGVSDGEVALCTDDGVRIGRVSGGIPVERSASRRIDHRGVSSDTTLLNPLSENHELRATVPRVVVDLRSARSKTLPLNLVPTLTTDHDTALVGAAVAPMTAWIDRMVTVSGRADLERAQRIAEDDAESAVVQLGASPAQTRIVQSTAYAMPYGDSNIIRIRVQAAEKPSALDQPSSARNSNDDS